VINNIDYFASNLINIHMESMTGFGKATCEFENNKFSIEIKSLNNKQTDIQVRLPQSYKAKEIEIRNLLISNLIRGKIELFLRLEFSNESSSATINESVFNAYLKQIKKLNKKQKLKLDKKTIFESIMRMPDVLNAPEVEVDEKEWKEIFDTIKKAIAQLVDFRKQEGKAIGKDILNRIENIRKLLQAVPAFEEERVLKIKERIQNNINENISAEKIDSNRLEQEIIFFLEKLDITEEKVRLSNHLKYFEKTASEKSPIGKKLTFISQEIGREINTLGSKASHAEIQKLVVQMKDELEKIKEQLMNVL